MKWAMITWIPWMCLAALKAQESPVLPSPDGLYMTHQSFMGGVPDHSPQDVFALWYLSDEDQYARGAFWDAGTEEAILPVVVCKDGDCFLLDQERTTSEIAYYARIWEIGAICLYQAYRTWEEMVTFKAYNPATGQPFREGTAPRTREMYFLVMWRPSTDEHLILDADTYEQWIGPLSDWQQDEPELIAGIRRYNRHMESMLD
jgi:hypothetical protein